MLFTWADGEMVVLFPDVESQRDGTGLGGGQWWAQALLRG